MQTEKINYFKEAFFSSWNYGVLAILVGFGILINNPEYIFPAVIAEAAVLLSLSQNKRFQRAIRARVHGDLPLSDPEDLARIRSFLDDENRKTFQKFDEICNQIKQNVESGDTASSSLLGISLGKLDYLMIAYLRMLLSRQKYLQHLNHVDREMISHQIDALNHEIQGRSGRVIELKMKNRDILLQRLERFDKAQENQEVIQAELDVMVNTVELLKDQTISITDPQGISQQIDAVLANMKDTDELVKEMDALMNQDQVQTLPEEPEIQGPDRRMHDLE
jgi:hypothetical protein